MAIVIQFAAALVLLSAAIYFARKRAYAAGYTVGQQDGRGETQQLKYHEGYTTGMWEGRLKAKLEAETTIQKAQLSYEQGFADALEAAREETYTAMHGETTIHLSA